MKKERNIFMTKQSNELKNISNPSSESSEIVGQFFYWGPLLFKIKLQPQDLEKCANLCSKKSSEVSDSLAGVIKHQHYVSSHQYYKIINPYLSAFRQAYNEWYGKSLTRTIQMSAAWVNFMVAAEFNPPHIHTKCDFSSVLFVKIPEALKEEHKKFTGTGGGPGAISFIHGGAQNFSISHINLLPEEGDFYMFPASLTHFVSPFTSKGERISISANFKFERNKIKEDK